MKTSAIYREHQRHPVSLLERIIYNYITTHRSIRELAEYYGVPKSTIASWLKKSESLVSYDLYEQYQETAAKHRRANAIFWNYGETEYCKTDGDGPLD